MFILLLLSPGGCFAQLTTLANLELGGACIAQDSNEFYRLVNMRPLLQGQIKEGYSSSLHFHLNEGDIPSPTKSKSECPQFPHLLSSFIYAQKVHQ
jgi:hypothetical protein